MIPRSTYRMQFHKAFDFADAIPLAPYLKQLGISHVYASPILAARAGSTHGYDVIDHTRLNPELGGEEGLRNLIAALRQSGLGLIVDIVPNHMAVGGADNPWWLDVLESGQASPYAAMFDIDWDPPDATMRGKVLVPILARPVDEALAAGDIKLVWDEALGKFAFAYHEHRLPLRREDYPPAPAGEATEARIGFLDASNQPDVLAHLLARQHYRLDSWRFAPETINWRSFFDVTGLAALRIEDERVFEAVHAKLFQLYSEGLIDGVRIDHVDGLTDPRIYCRRLRARLDGLAWQRPPDAPPGPAYIVVEKILAAREQLPADWAVDGTTGYDFMNDVSALQHDPNGEEPLTRLWSAISGQPPDFESAERSARRELLHASFECQLRATAAAFHRLALFAGHAIAKETLQTRLELLLEHLRAYRTYATGDAREPPPGAPFEAAMDAARNEIGADGIAARDFVAAAIRGELAEFGAVAHEAVRHFNQLATPLAAKAVEDTAFYRYGRLLSRNDVGFSPGTFAFSIAEFGESAKHRQERFPHTLLATATHDHKRGEDVRARLAVVSEMPDLWEEEVRCWFEINARLRPPKIDRGDEYQLYQTLVGTFPADFRPDSEGFGAYLERILGWREKSLREAKLRTSWREPDREFEDANAAFVRAILNPVHSPAFLGRLSAFVASIAPAGALNALTQCILRCTLPGVPDLYQGTEFWDFSLTDPDNRRPVEFAARTQAMIASKPPAALLRSWTDGRVKQALIARLLALRAEEPGCFAQGEYMPLAVNGRRRENVIAFLRRHESKMILIAVPRLCAQACAEAGGPLPRARFWLGTEIIIAQPRLAWRSILDSATRVAGGNEFPCAELFADFPGAVLVSAHSHQ